MLVFTWTKCSGASSPTISNPCHPLARGVEEIRIWDEQGTFRVIYTARVGDAVYVLHAFHKKSQATPKEAIALAKQRLQELEKEIRDE